MVDCNVTVADAGTSDAPKFSLKYMFEENIFHEIAVLVAPGGYFNGYLPIFQGNNSGQHNCAIFHNYVKEYFVAMGCKLEPQALQMPHMNNPDIDVFPAMAKCHSALLKSYSNKMAHADEIFQACESGWR